MRDYKSLSHTRWDCKYHVVFIPKRKQKLIYGSIRKYLSEAFHDLVTRKGIVIEEGPLMKDHVYMCPAEICGIKCSWLLEKGKVP